MYNDQNQRDFSRHYPGLSPSLMQDIFDVHQAYRFSNFHFAEYSVHDYASDTIKSGQKYIGIGAEFVNDHLVNSDYKVRFDFHLYYIINDSLFNTMDYVFQMSHFVNNLRNIIWSNTLMFK